MKGEAKKSDQYAARLAGFMFLFLMATVLASSILLRGVEGNDDVAEALRNLSESTLYAYLLLKARSIPMPLSLLGLVASLTLVVGVPLQTAAGQPTVDGATGAIWAPMFVFEIAAGLWLLIRGARPLAAAAEPGREQAPGPKSAG